MASRQQPSWLRSGEKQPPLLQRFASRQTEIGFRQTQSLVFDGFHDQDVGIVGVCLMYILLRSRPDRRSGRIAVVKGWVYFIFSCACSIALFRSYPNIAWLSSINNPDADDFFFIQGYSSILISKLRHFPISRPATGVIDFWVIWLNDTKSNLGISNRLLLVIYNLDEKNAGSSSIVFSLCKSNYLASCGISNSGFNVWPADNTQDSSDK